MSLCWKSMLLPKLFPVMSGIVSEIKLNAHLVLFLITSPKVTAYYYNEKIKGMFTARREAGETQNHIEALVGKEYLNRKDGDDWFKRYEKVIAGINSYVNYIRDKRKGDKGKGKRP